MYDRWLYNCYLAKETVAESGFPSVSPVSYTHLDVYKRQTFRQCILSSSGPVYEYKRKCHTQQINYLSEHVCVSLVVQECLVFIFLCVHVEYPGCYDVCVCVVCFNEVVSKGGLGDGV